MCAPDATAVAVEVFGPATRMEVADAELSRVVEVPAEPLVVFDSSTSAVRWLEA